MTVSVYPNYLYKEGMALTDLNLKTYDKIYPLFIQKYQSLVTDPNANILDKINQIVDYLNITGNLSNNVVTQWNNVMAWVMNDGLNTDVTNKINSMVADGTFNTLFNQYLAPSLGDITKLNTNNKSDIVDALNETFGDVQVNTAAIGDLTKLNTSDKRSLVAAINDNVASLVNITQNKIFLKDYPRQGNEMDDSGSFSRAFAAITDNTEVVFEKGKTYTISQGFTIKNNNVTLNGNGCTLNSTTTSATTLFQTNGVAYKTTNNANVSVGLKVSAITLPDVNGISVGDFVLLYNSVASGGYNTGIFAEILRIDSTNLIIYVSHPSETAFTADRISFYTPYLNIKIKGFTINATAYDIPIWLQFAKNSKVSHNILTGNGGRVGVNNNYSINCSVRQNYITGFRDDNKVDNTSGYGIHLGGHNNIAKLNIIKDCKHAITAGEGFHTCSKMKFRDNTVYAGTITTLHLLDFHNNCGGEIVNNYVYTFNNQGGICTRCSNVLIKDNKIVNDKNSTTYYKAIILGSSSTESPSLDNLQITGNEAYGKIDELMEFTTGINFTNVKLTDNTTENGYINFIGNIATALIEKNNLKNNAQIILPANAKDIRISKNVLIGGNTEYDNLVSINTGSSDIRITENIFTHQTGGGGVCVRTSSPYIQIEHNTFICNAGSQFNDVNAYANHIVTDNILYSLDYSTVTKWNPYTNYGTASIAASGTSIVVNHGLSATPTMITVTPQGNVGNVWITNITTSQFTINCATAPASATAVSWNARV